MLKLKCLPIVICFIFLYGCTVDSNRGTEFSITLSSPSPDSIYIEWETEAEISSYTIFRQSGEGGEYGYVAAIPNGHSYLDTGLQASTKYRYKIAYRDGDAERFIGGDFFAVTSPHFIAHRGYWDSNGSDENSLQSLRQAAELGVYGSEFDVQLTADNVPVVYHDNRIRGTDIDIQRALYDAIKDVVLKNNEKLPALNDYLAAGKTLSIQLILELKPHATAERDREAARIVTDAVRYFGLEDRVEYITFSLEAGKELIRLQPEGNVGYLSGDLTPQELKEYGFSTLSYNYVTMWDNPHYFDDAKSLGLAIAAWTINNFMPMDYLVDGGAVFITTDMPRSAQKYFEQKTYQYRFTLGE